MTFLTTVAAFLLTIGILVVIHEFGHYWVARRCGVKILRFSLGFGRPLFRWVRGPDRTEWIVAALPLGGYVRMLDERDPECAPISEEDLPRAFNRQSVLKRCAIVMAGPVANLLLAITVYWLLNLVGVYEPRAILAAPPAASAAAAAGIHAGDTVVAINDEPVKSWNDLRWRLLRLAVGRGSAEIAVQGSDSSRRNLQFNTSALHPADIEGDAVARLGIEPYSGPPRVVGVAPQSAAERAGLVHDDVVLAINQHELRSAHDLIEGIRNAPGKPIELLIKRGSDTRTVMVTPAIVEEAGAKIGRIGAELNDRPSAVKVQYGPIESLTLAVAKTYDTAIFSVKMLGRMVTGQASWRNLSGPVTIADYAGQTARIGLVAYLSFLALVSISLGVLNLLPVPMLDGGHLLYYAIEIFKGSPPADWVVEWGQRAGITLLALMTVLALYNDMIRLFT